MKLGIVGLPGSGKSTVFRGLTGLSQGEGRKSTQEPAVGVVKVEDERLDFLVASFHPKKITPIEIEFLDLGPTVGEGGGPGRGIPDRVIGTIRTLDALVHCVRFFDTPALGPASPLRDFSQLEDDFCLADLAVVEKRIERLEKDIKKGRKDLAEELALLTKSRAVLEEGKPLSTLVEAADSHIMRGFSFLTSKPSLILVNAGDDKSPEEVEEVLRQILETVEGRPNVLGDWLYGDAEAEIARLDENDAKEFLAEIGLSKPAAARVVSRAFQLLSLIVFFTCGEKEVRGWPLKRGLRAPEAAGTVHSDMQRGFIRAEVTAYDHFRELGSMAAAKKAGKVRLEGKDYTVNDGDMVIFLFGV